MKAITYHRYGPPEVLQPEELPKPKIKNEKHIRIQIRAAEVTKGDCELRSFHFPVKWFAPFLRLGFGIFRPRKKILGGYFSGVVEAVGKRVTRFKVGDEVYGASRLKLGSYAEYLVLPEHYPIAKKPENLSFEEAAAVPLGGLNALHFLRLAKIDKGEKVLVNGAGGSIGSFAIQIALKMGAVVSVVDHASKASMFASLPIEEFIDYEQSDFRSNKERYDVIFDMVASSPLEASLGALRSEGRYITANPTFRKMLKGNKIAKPMRKKVIFIFAEEKIEELETLKQWTESGDIFPMIDHVFPMQDVVTAHHRVEKEERKGITVLAIR